MDEAAFAATVGFTLEDLRRLTDEIAPGEHAAVVLVEHAWAGRLRAEDPRGRRAADRPGDAHARR